MPKRKCSTCIGRGYNTVTVFVTCGYCCISNADRRSCTVCSGQGRLAIPQRIPCLRCLGHGYYRYEDYDADMDE